MRGKIMVLNIFVCLVVGLMTACSGISGRTQRNSNPPTTPAASANTTPERSESQSAESQPKSPIRRVDFGNFTFPNLPTGKCSGKQIHLTNGRYDASENLVPRKTPSVDCWSVALGPIYYGDVTGDGEEEAMVTLYAELGGNSSFLDVYIYTLLDKRPALLWKFATGDRADGGLRRIHPENGELVIELYGIGTIAGKQLESSEDVGDCCPKHYTRTRYKWDGKNFQQDGEEEVLPNPSGSTAIIMPDHQS